MSAMLTESVGTREWYGYDHPRCGECGKFVPFNNPPDGYSPWGGFGDMEPPEDVYLCARCEEREFTRHLRTMRKLGVPLFQNRPQWQPSRGWFMARAIVRWERKHGSPYPVRHFRVREEYWGKRINYCEVCGKPEAHPIHNRDEGLRMRLQWHDWEKKFGGLVSRGIEGTGRCRKWCACGWNTGWFKTGEKYQQDIRPQWNDHGGISGDMYATWLLEQHVALAQGRPYPQPLAAAS